VRRGVVVPMKIISYNIRGLGAPEKKREIRKMCLERRVNIFVSRSRSWKWWMLI
jgi:hypothetical protein